MYVVTWGDGDLALVDGGKVVDASTTDAEGQLQLLLAKPARVWLPGDRSELLQPGDPGHVQAALAALPGLVISGED